MENYEDQEDISCTPEEIINIANVATANLLPEKSREIYNKEYRAFMDWRNQKGVTSFTERVLLAFFEEKSKQFRSSTLWSSYSKLKSTLMVHNNVDISKYPKLIAFLKRQSVGYKPKKSKTFSRQEVNKFLLEAPDKEYLMFKVVLIFGISGACRRDELYNMLIDNIEDKGSVLFIKIPDSKTHIQRSFTVIEDTGIENVNMLDLYRRYASLRPNNVKSRHFFLSYRNGRCTRQVIGINTFSKIPSSIAKYLKLETPEAYTGHSFRRTSASLLVDSGGDILKLKQHGGWKSSSVAEGYVDNSFKTKMDCASMILCGHDSTTNKALNRPSTPTSIDHNILISNTSNKDKPEQVPPTNSEPTEFNQMLNNLTDSKICITNPHSCTFNFNIMK